MDRATLLLLGSVPEALLAGLVSGRSGEDGFGGLPARHARACRSPAGRPSPAAHRSLPVPRRILASDGSLRVDLLLQDRNWPPSSARLAPDTPTLIITSHPLSTRECRRVLGLSARRRGMAVVSTRGMGGDPRRLRNLALHELGHLKGWRHCGTPGCLMNPVRTPGELDARGDSLCAECSGRRNSGCHPCSNRGAWGFGRLSSPEPYP